MLCGALRKPTGYNFKLLELAADGTLLQGFTTDIAGMEFVRNALDGLGGVSYDMELIEAFLVTSPRCSTRTISSPLRSGGTGSPACYARRKLQASARAGCGGRVIDGLVSATGLLDEPRGRQADRRDRVPQRLLTVEQLPVRPRTVEGTWIRHVPHGADFLGRADIPSDGRWQRGDVVRALYLADTVTTATAEWYQAW